MAISNFAISLISNHSDSKIMIHSEGNWEKRELLQGGPMLALLCGKSEGLLLDFEELLGAPIFKLIPKEESKVVKFELRLMCVAELNSSKTQNFNKT